MTERDVAPRKTRSCEREMSCSPQGVMPFVLLAGKSEGLTIRQARCNHPLITVGCFVHQRSLKLVSPSGSRRGLRRG